MTGRLYGVLVVAGAMVAGPACDSGDSNRGSETHWLDACDSSDACGPSLKCMCGTCTLPCAQTNDCVSLGVSATCAPSSVVESLCPASVHASSLCLPICDVAGGCRDRLTCTDGVCSPGAPAHGDSGAPRVPDGGKPPPAKDAGGRARPPDAAANVDAGAHASTDGSGAQPDGATPRREGGVSHPDASIAPDAAPEAGGAECRPGFHVVSTGACNPILFSDDFESGALPGDWLLWRRAFVETGGQLQVQDGSPRAGFNYGAAGNGRGGIIATHLDDASWTDYRLDFDVAVLQAGSYNPYGLQSCTRRLDLYFRVEQLSESWNQPETGYAIGLQTKTCDQDVQGTVSLGSLHGYYCPGVGWGCSTAGESRGLFSVVTPAIVDGPNHYTIEVVGDRIQFWANGTRVFDYTDDVVPYPVGATAITRGGISLSWIWELLGWADNVVVTDMR